MIKIAIIEDDEDVRESLKILVETTEGLECTGAFCDAESGLEFLTADPADIVLMDIHLPGMDGIECVRQLKSVHPEMHFIMCTVFRDDNSVFNALKAGATGYLLKNEDPDKIAEAIFELHSGGSPMTPQIARRVLESFNKPAVHDEIHLLTKRETELLGFVSKGFRNKEIADKLFISLQTVKDHTHRIYSKVDVKSRVQLIKMVGEIK